MSAYYNEVDRYAVAWLRELMAEGLIAPGVVDDRPIQEVKPADVEGFTQAHFFAGIGVWSYALRSAGWPDSRAVWTGSCPCQPFSVAGRKGGLGDERHLWPVWFPLIRECRPYVLFGEQVSSPDGYDWLDLVSVALESEAYAFGALDTCAASVGAPMRRQRLYWVADTDHEGREGRERARKQGAARVGGTPTCRESLRSTSGPWPPGPCEVGNIPVQVDGSAGRMGRLRGYGNALCGPQAEAFIASYMEARGCASVWDEGRGR